MYARQLIIISFLFVLSFCSYARVFQDDFYLRLASSFKVTFNPALAAGSLIQAPMGGRVVIADIYLKNTESEILHDCIVYEVPSKKNAGSLFFINLKKEENCKSQTFKTPYAFKKDIYNFSFNLFKTTLILNIDEHTEKINFFNEESPLVSFISQRGSFLEEFSICQETSNECEQSFINRCKMCPQGKTYQVIASDCKGKSLRSYCGDKNCGKKGMPACYRGRGATNYTGPFCLTDSPLGFCEKPLRVVCINDELYCR